MLTLPNSNPGATSAGFNGVDNMDGTDECAAAMVLMSLSCSPRSPQWDQNGKE